MAGLAARPPTSLSEAQIVLLATAVTNGLLPHLDVPLTADEVTVLVTSACKCALREGTGTSS